MDKIYFLKNNKGFTQSLNFAIVARNFFSNLKKYFNAESDFKYIPNKIVATKKVMAKSSAGFTLVEALIAISVLLVAVVEPLSLTSKSVFNANVGKDQITASYLAQEAMEFIRNKRDTNLLTGNTGSNWLSGLEKCMTNETNPDSSNYCTFDALDSPNDSNSYISCSSDSDCSHLQFINIPGGVNLKRYGFEIGYPETSFERSVTMTEIVPGREVDVTVKVLWRTVNLDRSFVIRERLWNWGY